MLLLKIEVFFSFVWGFQRKPTAHHLQPTSMCVCVYVWGESKRGEFMNVDADKCLCLAFANKWKSGAEPWGKVKPQRSSGGFS